jgi:hypothetical protein
LTTVAARPGEPGDPRRFTYFLARRYQRISRRRIVKSLQFVILVRMTGLHQRLRASGVTDRLFSPFFRFAGAVKSRLGQRGKGLILVRKSERKKQVKLYPPFGLTILGAILQLARLANSAISIGFAEFAACAMPRG